MFPIALHARLHVSYVFITITMHDSRVQRSAFGQVQFNLLSPVLLDLISQIVRWLKIRTILRYSTVVMRQLMGPWKPFAFAYDD